MVIASAAYSWHRNFLFPGYDDFQSQAANLRPSVLSAKEIIQRSSESYRALISYSVSSTSIGFEMRRPRLLGTADMYFRTPGKFRIEGVANMFMVRNPFKIIFDGKTVAEDPLEPQKGTIYRSLPESAIAGYTGTAGSAAVAIPALIQNYSWGYPFKGSWESDGEGMLYGKAVYQISREAKGNPCPHWMLWLDAKTYLISQERRDCDNGMQIVRYTREAINPTLRGSLFDPAEIAGRK